MSAKDKTLIKNAKKMSQKRIFIRLVIVIALVGLGIAVPKLLSDSTDFIENVYSRGLYPVISTVVGFISSLIPFSLAEYLIYALAIGVVLSLVITFVCAIARKAKWHSFLSMMVGYMLTAAILFNLFYLMWGFNYSRARLADILELEVREYTKEELFEVSALLADRARELREDVPEDENGVFFVEKELYADYFQKAADAYSNDYMSELSDIFNRKVYKAKQVAYSLGLSKLGISGIFIPFTEECNVNVNQPTLYIFCDAAHENAHYMGIAREDEASFLAYVVCANSGDTVLEYSATMSALNSCANRLYGEDSELYGVLNAQHYSDAMRRDLASYSEYYAEYDTEVREASQDMNDNYLKYNNQDDGIKSYGMMVDLTLAYFLNRI